MKKWTLQLLIATLTIAAVVTPSIAQDPGLGKRKPGSGGGGNGGGGGGSTPPPKQDPPPHTDPPPRRNDPDRSNGGGNGGGSVGSGGGNGSGSGGNERVEEPTRTGGDSRGTVIIDQDGGKRRPQGSSRSGTVRYGTVSNASQRGNPIRVDRVPTNLGTQVNRSERIVRWGTLDNGIRYGYYQYRRDWRDDYFCYPHYVFDPYAGYNCVVSPWYYYPMLPPYLSTTRVVYVTSFPSPWVGSVYDYRPYDEVSRRDRSALDDSLDDMVAAFERGDRKAVDALVPRRGSVNMYQDGRYTYSLSVDDFYDMYYDVIDSTRTKTYDIVDVRWDGNEAARVKTRHSFTDPWGTISHVYHTYYLVKERRNFVIREFGTSNQP